MSFVKPPVIQLPTNVFQSDDPTKAQDVAAQQQYFQRLFLPDSLTWDFGDVNAALGARALPGYRWAHRPGVVRSGRTASVAIAGTTLTFQIHWFDFAFNDHVIWAAAGDRITTTVGGPNLIEKPATGAQLVVDPTNPDKLGIFWVELAAVTGVGTVPNVMVEVLLDPVET